MGLTMKERKAITAALRKRYARARKKEKGRLLDELVELTGYNRWYAAGLLATPAAPPPAIRPRVRRQRRRIYDATVLATLRQVWMIMDCICGKRLQAVLAETMAVLERHCHLSP